MINRQKFIGDRIRTARQAANLSQRELAQKIGFESATAISLIEAGERKIAIVEMEKIAKILHQPINYFLGESGKQVNVVTALRAEKNITEGDKQAILHILDLAKNRYAGNSMDTKDRSS